MTDAITLLRKNRSPGFVDSFLAKHAEADPNELRNLIDNEIHGVAHVPMTDKMEIPEGPYKCHKCGSKRVLCRNVQTRSMDEGMTSFFLCECGFTFKE